MNKDDFIDEVEKRLNRIFKASKDGYKASLIERHRLEGFMSAGVYMGVVTNAELAKVMNDIHVSIFGQSIEQRKAEKKTGWQVEVIDYSAYEQPAFERKDG